MSNAINYSECISTEKFHLLFLDTRVPYGCDSSPTLNAKPVTSLTQTSIKKILKEMYHFTNEQATVPASVSYPSSSKT